MGKIKSFAVVGLLCCLLASTVNAAAGDLYVGGLNDKKIYEYSPGGGSPTVFLSNQYAESVAFDRQGNLYLADRTIAKKVYKVTPAGTKTEVLTGIDATGFLVDLNNNVFVSDYTNGIIIKLTPQGTHTTYASGIDHPYGIAGAPQGNLYVAENTTGKILKVAPDGSNTTFVSTGLNLPAQLLSDGSGNLYVADSGSGNVYMFTSAGSRSTVESGISSVFGLAQDEAGNLFASSSAQQIYKIPPGGSKQLFASGNLAGGLAIEPNTNPLLNISTRANVLTNENVVIAGFIITGTVSKQVFIRGLGPTLGGANPPVNNPLQDPMLQLTGGSVSITNLNWADAANANSIPMSLRPTDSRESAILTTLQPGGYSAILSGENSTTGVGQVEVFDLSRFTNAELVNISTRAFVGTGDNILDGGFITDDGNGFTRVVVRAKGPSLAGVSNKLADPELSLFDGNGAQVAFNDNWKDTQQDEILRTGLQPDDDAEAAIVAIVPSGGHSAIVSGNSGTTGVGQVEIFRLP